MLFMMDLSSNIILRLINFFSWTQLAILTLVRVSEETGLSDMRCSYFVKYAMLYYLEKEYHL